jgi:hypothetical protein
MSIDFSTLFLPGFPLPAFQTTLIVEEQRKEGTRQIKQTSLFFLSSQLPSFPRRERGKGVKW